jgi:hypothetical protein
MFKGPVEAGLGVCGKAAGGKLPRPQVVGDALAANALLGTRFIAAVAFFEILFLSALHFILLSNINLTLNRTYRYF